MSLASFVGKGRKTIITKCFLKILHLVQKLSVLLHSHETSKNFKSVFLESLSFSPFYCCSRKMKIIWEIRPLLLPSFLAFTNSLFRVFFPFPPSSFLLCFRVTNVTFSLNCRTIRHSWSSKFNHLLLHAKGMAAFTFTGLFWNGDSKTV